MDVKPGYKQTEVGVIPDEWSVVRIGDASVKVGSGITPTGGQRVYRREGRPFIRSQNVGWGPLLLHDVAFIDEPTHATFSGTEIKCEDVFLNISGASIGRSSIADKRIEGGNVNQHVCIIRTDKQQLAPLFLNFILLSSIGQAQIDSFQAGGNREGLNFTQVRSIVLPQPAIREQRAIASALSDVDGLLGALDRLIAKKRDLKQAAMQQLLTGQTRLPGFTGAWERTSLGSCGSTYVGISGKSKVDFGHGKARYVTFLNVLENAVIQPAMFDKVDIKPGESQNRVQRGDLLFNGTSETPGDLALGACVDHDHEDLYLNSFCFGFRFHKQTDHDPQFFAYFFRGPTGRQIMSVLAQGATRYNMSKRQFLSLECELPEGDEQRAIAQVLSDMDAELASLEHRRDKTRAIKQGMMQELLTGRTRLVKPQAPELKLVATSPSTKGHNWAINEAVVIATLVKHFGSEGFPLGRKRYTKFSYLLHRHAERVAEGYLKKAAGPYNPQTKYAGPEKIAQKNGYIKRHKGPKGHSGFITADSVAKAEAYFDKWYGPEVIRWLEQFHYSTNDDLEVLTTVDMAVQDLRANGKSVDVAAVKDVIASHPEWKAKLDRACFADANISAAIYRSETLFGENNSGANHA